ncbi:hypothetical protein [Methanoculleus bourgensis]|nr:hypothetical protein [Methanoculleus bourgensis]
MTTRTTRQQAPVRCEIPEAMMTEAVANAVICRDSTRNGSSR